jgi:RHS repeat-associated protein
MTEERFYRGMHGDKLPNNGTRTVKVKDSEGGEREDSDWLSGLSFESQVHDGTGDTVTSKTISTPAWAGPTATRGDYKAYWVGNGSTTSYTALRSGGWRKTRTETKYDDHGQVTESNDLGDLATPSDDRCTRTSYVQDAARWIWSSPLQSETVAVHCGETAVFPQHAIGGTKNTYDDAGNLTSVATLDARPASGPVFATVVTTSYDKYGRALTSTDPLGNTVSTEYTPAAGGPVTQVVVTDQLGHTTTTEVEPAWGVGTKLVDANQNVTEGEYDALGRTTRVWRANRLRAEYPDDPSVKMDYDVSRDKPSSIRTTSVNAVGEYMSGTVVFDGQYRTRQAQTATTGGRLIVDTRYDSQGRVSRTTQPFFNAGPVDTNLLVFSETDVPGLTRSAFDGSGRQTASIYQAGGQEKWRSTTAYGGDRVDVTPPAGGTPTTSVTDARGQVTELWQYKGATASGDHDVTRYSYSTAGKLATATDAAGNTWRWHHDLRGRLVKSEDVDRGVTEMTYDAANRLTTSKDARGTVLTQEYDAAGRKTAVKSGATVLAKFEYDTAEYGKGLPASSTRYVNGNAYVSKILSYTELNKPLAAEVHVPDAEGPLRGVYTRWYTYSPDGTVTGEGLGAVPAAGMPTESVVHGFDELGRPRSTTASLTGQGTDNLVNTTGYTRLGELYRLELGNVGKRTWLSYYYDDSTRRMNRYIVDAEVAAPMQADVNYTYDQIGNITSVADTTQGQLPDRQCFQYDHLRRLTEAWTPSTGCDAPKSTGSLAGPAPYWHSYTYDQIGNRRTEVQHAASGDTTRTYSYPATGSPRAHAADSVTTTGPGGSRLDQFTYSEIGATTSRKVNGSEQTLEWDAEGRVAKVTEGAKVSEFLYSATGERLIRRDPQGTTLYLGDEEIRLAKGATAPTTTRYYRHGGQIVAMREGKTKLTWLAADMQGTAHIAIDRATMKVDRRRQLPFGAPRGTNPAFPGERGFVGGTNDTATGLVNIGARQYDAALGKFISVDPIMMALDPQQWNAYAYANNSPITFSDPTGLAYCDYNVCDGDTGYKPNGQRNNKDGKCVQYCGNPHNAPKKQPPNPQPSSPKMCASASGYPAAVPCGSQSTGTTGNYGHTSSGYPACTGCGQRGSAAVTHLVFDFLGLFPVVGEPADLTNCAAYASEGQTTDAVLSCAGAAPLVGWGFTVAKWIRGGDKVKDVGRGAEEAVQAGAKCPNSFSGDTLVLMADGTTKRIDEIEVGDEVANSQPKSDKVEQHKVLAVIVTDDDKDYVDLAVSTPNGPKVIRSTAHHPFFNATTGDWEEAGTLEAGDLLSTPGNGRAELLSVNRYAAFMRTFNLTVETVHTYYVLAGFTPVLVHNCNFALGKADEHYDKHVLGLDDAGNPTRTPDMPEYDYDGGFEKYVEDACSLMCGALPSGAREFRRSTDGVLIRLDSNGRIGMLNGEEITTFFRPDDPVAYFNREAAR